MRGDPRSKFIVPDRRELFALKGDRFNITPFNVLKHVEQHEPVMWTYTSKTALDTNISTPWYATQDWVIQTVKAHVTGAPVSTDLVWDVLIDGSSIFRNTAERPKVKAGDLNGRLTVPSRQGWPAGSKLQCQGVTISSATGPLGITFQLTQG